MKYKYRLSILGCLMAVSFYITTAQNSKVNYIGEMIFLSAEKNNEGLSLKMGDVIEFNQLNTFFSNLDKDLQHQVSDYPSKK